MVTSVRHTEVDIWRLWCFLANYIHTAISHTFTALECVVESHVTPRPPQECNILVFWLPVPGMDYQLKKVCTIGMPSVAVCHVYCVLCLRIGRCEHYRAS